MKHKKLILGLSCDIPLVVVNCEYHMFLSACYEGGRGRNRIAFLVLCVSVWAFECVLICISTVSFNIENL